MNNSMQALIYTRPHKRFILDYCYFAYPAGLSQTENSLLNEHIRNVMAVESYCGDIRDVRWHILRLKNYVLVGIATEKLGRIDSSKSKIRGYYGILMPVDSAVIPSWSTFEELDKLFVTPHYMDDYRFEPVQPALVPDELVQPVVTPEDEASCMNIQLNLSSESCKLIPVAHVDNLDALLNKALRIAVENESFELVYGFNNKRHAMTMPVMNAICHEVESEELILQPGSALSSEPVNHRATVGADEKKRIRVYAYGNETGRGDEAQRPDPPRRRRSRRGSPKELLRKILPEVVVRMLPECFGNQSFKDEREEVDNKKTHITDEQPEVDLRTTGMRSRKSHADKEFDSTMKF